MSTQTEITRLQTARNAIRTWLVGLGLATSTDKLDVLATKAAAIKNNGAVDAQVKEGESYNIPAGYHNGSGTVKGVAGGGNYQLQAKSVTPTKEQQSEEQVRAVIETLRKAVEIRSVEAVECETLARWQF